MLLWFYEGYGCDFGYCDVRKKSLRFDFFMQLLVKKLAPLCD
jgi:hypothetical protein